MRELIKRSLVDSRIEPYARWLVKRSRGIRMPFDLVKNEIYDRQAFEVIQRVLSPDSNCVDVGCHEGVFLEQFLKYAPRGRHYAFEPIPHLAERLKAKYAGVKIFNCALSDTSGEAVFYVIPEAPALSGLNSREFLEPEKTRQPVRVRTERLDDLVSADTKIDLIKLDVEGAEGMVLRGALETIKRDKPCVILEHGSISSMAFGVSSAEIYELLVEKCGLQISTLRGWLHGEPPLTKSKFCKPDDWYFLAHR